MSRARKSFRGSILMNVKEKKELFLLVRIFNSAIHAEFDFRV